MLPPCKHHVVSRQNFRCPHCALQTPIQSPAASTRRPHLTKLRCTPRLLCTPAHVRQMKTPYGTEDHVGFLAGQSKQTCMAAGCVRGRVRAAADSHDTMGLVAPDDNSLHCPSILCQLKGVLQCEIADQSCRAPLICAMNIASVQRNAFSELFQCTCQSLRTANACILGVHLYTKTRCGQPLQPSWHHHFTPTLFSGFALNFLNNASRSSFATTAMVDPKLAVYRCKRQQSRRPLLTSASQ